MLLSNPLSKMPCGVWLFILCDNSLMYWSKDLNLSAFPLDILRWKDKDNRTLSLFKDFNNNSILIISNNKILTVECPFSYIHSRPGLNYRKETIDEGLQSVKMVIAAYSLVYRLYFFEQYLASCLFNGINT